MKYCPEFIEYIAIIANRQLNPLNENEYGENHHIWPRSFGGSNKERNIVRLTPEEHYRCHSLLPFIFQDEPENKKKMLSAWHFLTNTRKGMPISEIEYGKLKREYSIAQSNRFKGKKQSPQAIANMKKAQQNRSLEWRMHISQSKMGNKGRTGMHTVHSEETKRKIGIASKRSMSNPEIKAKISNSLKGQVQSQATREKRRQSMKAYWAKRKAAQHLQS